MYYSQKEYSKFPTSLNFPNSVIPQAAKPVKIMQKPHIGNDRDATRTRNLQSRNLTPYHWATRPCRTTDAVLWPKKKNLVSRYRSCWRWEEGVGTNASWVVTCQEKPEER